MNHCSSTPVTKATTQWKTSSKAHGPKKQPGRNDRRPGRSRVRVKARQILLREEPSRALLKRRAWRGAAIIVVSRLDQLLVAIELVAANGVDLASVGAMLGRRQV